MTWHWSDTLASAVTRWPGCDHGTHDNIATEAVKHQEWKESITMVMLNSVFHLFYVPSLSHRQTIMLWTMTKHGVGDDTRCSLEPMMSWRYKVFSLLSPPHYSRSWLKYRWSEVTVTISVNFVSHSKTWQTILLSNYLSRFIEESAWVGLIVTSVSQYFRPLSLGLHQSQCLNCN